MGRLVDCNAPQSYDWQVDLLTLAECEPLIRRHYPMFKNWDVSVAEQALIQKHRPCLNVQWNHAPQALPQRYHCPEATKRQVANLLHVPYHGAVLPEPGDVDQPDADAGAL